MGNGNGASKTLDINLWVYGYTNEIGKLDTLAIESSDYPDRPSAHISESPQATGKSSNLLTGYITGARVQVFLHFYSRVYVGTRRSISRDTAR